MSPLPGPDLLPSEDTLPGASGDNAGDAIYLQWRYLAIDDATDSIIYALSHAAGRLFNQARSVAIGDDSDRPGQLLWDPAVAELWALRWTAQLSGAPIPSRYAGESDSDYLDRVRDAVIHVLGWRRGTPAALAAIARGRLTDTKTVTITERYQGSVWRVRVDTLDEETPTPELTRQDLHDPEGAVAGMRIIYRETTGWTIGEMEADTLEFPTIGDLEAGFATIGDLEANP